MHRSAHCDTRRRREARHDPYRSLANLLGGLHAITDRGVRRVITSDTSRRVHRGWLGRAGLVEEIMRGWRDVNSRPSHDRRVGAVRMSVYREFARALERSVRSGLLIVSQNLGRAPIGTRVDRKANLPAFVVMFNHRHNDPHVRRLGLPRRERSLNAPVPDGAHRRATLFRPSVCSSASPRDKHTICRPLGVSSALGSVLFHEVTDVVLTNPCRKDLGPIDIQRISLPANDETTRESTSDARPRAQ